jgi:hypothetical protein
VGKEEKALHEKPTKVKAEEPDRETIQRAGNASWGMNLLDLNSHNILLSTYAYNNG